jgi:hypothetical protein
MAIGTISNYLEDKLLDHTFNNVAYTPPSTVYVSLSTADPGESGSGLSEVAYTNYARQAISFSAASSRVITHGSAISFPQSGSSGGTATHYFLADASSGGNVLASAALSASQSIASGNTPSIASGEIDIAFELRDYTVASIDATANTLTVTGLNGKLTAGTRVYVSATTTLAAPLVADTVYFVISPTGNTIQLSATSGGSAIDLTNTGTGTHTISRCSNLSDYLANTLLNFAFRNQTFTSPSTYAGLATANITDANTGSTITELTGTSYARVQVAPNGGTSPTWDLATSGLVDNTHNIDWSPGGTWSTFTAIFVADASSAGNLLVYDNSITSQGAISGDTVRVAAGDFDISLA